jgi:hypothetical protein
MKKSLLAIALMFSIGVVHAEAELKKACVKNEKTGKEVCKTIKTHKKLDGTKVTDAKKK